MIEIFLASVFAGIILGAPVGVAGAMVADAALSHARKRLYATIFAASSGDSVLAVLLTLFAPSFRDFLERYQRQGLFAAGALIFIAGIYMAVVTAVTHRGIVKNTDVAKPSKWILTHAAPAVAVFFIAVFHPGNIAAFLTLMTVFSLKFSGFLEYRLVFAAGIFLGSLLIFSLSGFVFWKIRKKADRFVHYLRYTLSVTVILLGVYLVIENF